MYGIMEMSDNGLKAGIEGNGMPSWSVMWSEDTQTKFPDIYETRCLGQYLRSP
jgi:hypothetical protein